MSATEPAPLAPIGPTDSYTYPNGLMVFWGNREGERKHDRTVVFHMDVMHNPVIVPADLYHVIYSVAYASGLSMIEASLLVEAAERYA